MREILAFCLLTAVAMAAPVKLRCDHQLNPIGYDAAAPRFSWQSDNVERNWRQSAYQMLVATIPENLAAEKADVWNSGKQMSGESVGIVYGGPAPKARQRYYWTVRVWDGDGKPSRFAPAAWWETGLLTKDNWTAQWISRVNPEEEADRAAMHWIWAPGQNALEVPPKTAAVFRTSFDLSAKPQRAAVFLIARGNFKISVNGTEVAAKSNWNDFDRQEIDHLLTAGKNTIEVAVTAREPSPWPPGASQKQPAALALLVKITEADGTLRRIGTGAQWEARLAADSDWKPAGQVGDLSDPRLGPVGPLPQPVALFRRDFQSGKKIQQARLYVTALGSYRISINGKPAGNAVLTPEFTDYRKRVYYQTYDVTGALVPGPNTIAAMLADGWYSSPLTWTAVHLFTPPNRLMAQLEIRYQDGTMDTIGTDNSWTTSQSQILFSTIYAGETYDARLEQAGWNRPGFHGDGWTPAAIASAPDILIASPVTPAVEVGETMEPKSVTPLSKGVYVFDMGQNMVGWVSLKVRGPAGTAVRLRFAEILNPGGNIYRENLRNADATDWYILRGSGEESFTPRFTFHGFRYVEVTGYPGKPTLNALSGHVVGSLNEAPSGRLITSSKLVNQMWKIGLWGQRGNFLSIPTDCPQRDERLGWMGDAGVFWRTGAYNFDIASFTRKFMLDSIDAQSAKGAFANTSPDLLAAEGVEGAPGWGDAGVIMPWTAWLQYGDRGFITENWDAMQRWMNYIASANPDFLRRNAVGPNFADWLAPDERSPKDLVATAYWALLANMMSDMAQAAGKESDAKQYQELFDHIRGAYQKAFVKDTGEVAGGTQTAYLLTLYAKLAPKELESAMVTNLAQDIESRGGHLSTGFLGTPFLLFTLADHGRADLPTSCYSTKPIRPGATCCRKAPPPGGSAGTATPATPP